MSGILGWQFGWTSGANDNSLCWHHEVGYGDKNNTKSVSARVREHPAPVFSAYQGWLLAQLPPNAKIVRFYLNAHTYGTDSWPHTDFDKPGQRTAVLYLAKKWLPGWGGETVVLGKSHREIMTAVLPARNRLMIFPANRVHAPRPLVRAFCG